MNQQKYAFKNYIFDFYGTLVDIETDESSPVLWETMAQIYQSYGAHYTGESLQVRYKELVQQAEQSIAKEKQDTYPEIDLTVIFVQLSRESSNRSQCPSFQRVGTLDCSDLPCPLSQKIGALSAHERSLRRHESCRVSDLSLIQCPSGLYQPRD